MDRGSSTLEEAESGDVLATLSKPVVLINSTEWPHTEVSWVEPATGFRQAEPDGAFTVRLRAGELRPDPEDTSEAIEKGFIAVELAAQPAGQNVPVYLQVISPLKASSNIRFGGEDLKHVELGEDVVAPRNIEFSSDTLSWKRLEAGEFIIGHNDASLSCENGLKAGQVVKGFKHITSKDTIEVGNPYTPGYINIKGRLFINHENGAIETHNGIVKAGTILARNINASTVEAETVHLPAGESQINGCLQAKCIIAPDGVEAKLRVGGLSGDVEVSGNVKLFVKDAEGDNYRLYEPAQKSTPPSDEKPKAAKDDQRIGWMVRIRRTR